MADLDKKQTGASPVEQSNNIDGLSEVNNRPIKEIDEKDLDRGQELYTGFGFGSVDASDVEVEDIAKSKAVPGVSEGKSDEHVFVADGASSVNKDKSVPKKTIANEESTVFETARSNEAQNIVPNKVVVDKRVENRRVVPEDTKIVIKPDNGDVVYTETTVDRPATRSRVVTTEKIVNPTNRATGLAINEESAIDVPADYQLAGVYYGNDYRDNRNYLTSAYQTDTYSIKRHYKNQAKEKKGGLSIKKIALGVAAVAGVVWLIKDEDSFLN